MQTWTDIEQLLIDSAADDLGACGEVTPCLAAFRGEEPLFLAFWRPFPKGGYERPFIELTSLAMPLDADRLALSMGGRAWSLEDPIVPVLPEGDLRQRVLCIHSADATSEPTTRGGTMIPFDLRDGQVRWGEPVRDAPRGWLPDALVVAVEHRAALRATDKALRKQARRCARLGHRLYLAPALADRLEVSVRP